MLKENQLQAAKIGPLEGKIQTGVDVKEEIQKKTDAYVAFYPFLSCKTGEIKARSMIRKPLTPSGILKRTE